MARRRRGRKTQSRQRENMQIRHGNRRLYRPDYRAVEDRRMYREIGGVPLLMTGEEADYEVARHRVDSRFGPNYRVAVKDLRRTLVCRRRRDRRENLFARAKIGKGKKVSPKRRWSETSDIVCK